MYKWLLCWRYLWTRYLALASVVSVMLGVGTLVVVNSVMAGFSSKLLAKFRGMKSDITVKYQSVYGFANLQEKLDAVRKRLGPRLQAVAPVIDTFAMAEYHVDRSTYTIKKPLQIVGIDPGTRVQTNDFARWLTSPENQADPGNCFELRGEARENYELYYGGPRPAPRLPMSMMPPNPGPLTPLAPPYKGGENKGGESVSQAEQLRPVPPPSDPPETDPPRPLTAIVGWGLASFRNPHAHATTEQDKREVKDRVILHRGDIIRLTFATRDDIVGLDGAPRAQTAHTASFVVADHFRSDVHEIDRNFVFIDIHDLQQLQTMHDMATSLHLRLTDYDRDVTSCLADLRELFPEPLYDVRSWQEDGTMIFSAIAVERSILNVLLFLIIAVAGFGILAIFFMIVVEKTRDIGVLKALGASNAGVMGIFLSYGMLLGLVGAGLGTLGGIAFTLNINEIERFLSSLTGQDVFPRDVYFFDKIPVDLSPWMLLWVNFGAVVIATAASVFPALRAAMLHPVRALRFE